MRIKLASAVLFSFLLPILICAVSPDEIDKNESLVFRFTGPEAQRLLDYLKKRTPELVDREVRYHGDKTSLACSERNVCYLHLSKKEWQSSQKKSERSLTLHFILPMSQTVLNGELALSSSSTADHSNLQLQIQDAEDGDSFAFTQELHCPLITEWTDEYLQGNGDCRLELSSARKDPSYQESVYFTHNSDNAVSVVKGPWAEKLFKHGGPMEVEPNNPSTGRVKVGSDFYCWRFDLLTVDNLDPQAYVCQIKLFPSNKDGFVFSWQGEAQGNESFSLILRPKFEKSLLQGFNLIYKSGTDDKAIDYCPNKLVDDAPTNCSFVLNYKRSVEYYPIFKPVQGVSVGWGVNKE